MNTPAWIQLLVGIGTILLAIIALFGPRINSRFFPARIKVLLHNPHGKLEQDQNGPKYCFHLWILNTKPWMPVSRVRILLRAAYKRKDSSQQWEPIVFPVPRQFIWAPAEHCPEDPTISHDKVLDLGVLSQGRVSFSPSLYPQGGLLDASVYSGETVRYVLEVNADGYFDKNHHFVEVHWSGTFPTSVTDVATHLQISITQRKGS